MAKTERICAVCDKALSDPISPMFPDYHLACAEQVVQAIRNGCPVCEKPVTGDDCVLDKMDQPVRAYHAVCRNAEIDEMVNSGLDQNVREGLMERKTMPDGTVKYWVTEKGNAKVREMISRGL
jgi:hypothetical protein